MRPDLDGGLLRSILERHECPGYLAGLIAGSCAVGAGLFSLADARPVNGRPAHSVRGASWCDSKVNSFKFFPREEEKMNFDFLKYAPLVFQSINLVERVFNSFSGPKKKEKVLEIAGAVIDKASDGAEDLPRQDAERFIDDTVSILNQAGAFKKRKKK